MHVFVDELLKAKVVSDILTVKFDLGVALTLAIQAIIRVLVINENAVLLWVVQSHCFKFNN